MSTPKAGDIWLYMGRYHRLREITEADMWATWVGTEIGDEVCFGATTSRGGRVCPAALEAHGKRVCEHDGAIRIPKEKA